MLVPRRYLLDDDDVDVDDDDDDGNGDDVDGNDDSDIPMIACIMGVWQSQCRYAVTRALKYDDVDVVADVVANDDGNDNDGNDDENFSEIDTTGGCDEDTDTASSAYTSAEGVMGSILLVGYS